MLPGPIEQETRKIGQATDERVTICGNEVGSPIGTLE